MERQPYSAADITVLSRDEAVRQRPAMYFGVDHQHPDLATRILTALIIDALHLPNGEHRKTSVEIIGDQTFTIIDDQIRETDEQGVPKLDHQGALLDRRRWAQAAAAALSARTIIEVCAKGRGYRQELAGTRPQAPPQRVVASLENGTLATYELDESYLIRNAAVATSLESRESHGEWCASHPLADSARVTDLRRSAQ